MHKKSLSEILLENSQMSGVILTNTSTDLSSIGHGLYIKSNANDQYADLRLIFEKPFWGHTHPLSIQNQFKKLTRSNQELPFYISNTSDLENFKTYEKISYKNFDPKIEKNYHIIFDESFLISPDKNHLFKDIMNSTQDCILEFRDLILAANDGFYFENIPNKKMICHFTLENIVISNFEIITSSPPLALVEAMNKYLTYLVWGEDGKLQRDQKLIDDILDEFNNYERIGNYILFKGNFDASIQKSFLSNGLYISNFNISNNCLILCIPLACTNAELLDTLERIKVVMKEF